MTITESREYRSKGRPRSFSEDEAMAAVMALFWEKGFEGTSMADIMAATGLMKGSLYGAFGDKRALYLKAIERYEATELAAGVAIVRANGAPTERIGRLLQAVIDAVLRGDRRGCLICNAAVDQAPVNQATERSVLGALGLLERSITDALAERGLTGPAGEDAARTLVAGYHGMRVLAKAGVAPEALSAVRRCLLEKVANGCETG